MNPDADPPLAGEETGVQPPAEKDRLPYQNPAAPDPAAALTARAKRLREHMCEYEYLPRDTSLLYEFDQLHALASDLLLKGAGIEGLTEHQGLKLALRAQKQALAVYIALKRVQALEHHVHAQWPL
jgi:hypothetical protein